jgi:hypothetical protein
LIDKCRNIVADVENEPDRDEAHDAIEVGLKKITNDVAIKESHEGCEVVLRRQFNLITRFCTSVREAFATSLLARFAA